jgi:putative oxidoreductase
MSTSPYSLSLPTSPVATALRSLVRTDADLVPALARVALGVVMLPHGLQKSVGWFGGYGFAGTMGWFTGTLHIPWIFGFAAIATETAGALALIAGFASRLAALGVGAIYIVAIATVHGQHGFFMNWEGTQKGEGIEFFVFGLALVLIVLWRGGGAASVDRTLTRRFSR